MRRQIFDPLIRAGLFVGAVETLQRERDVVGQPLQQFGELRRERVPLLRHVDHDADRLAAHQQRKRGAGLRAVAGDHGLERRDTLVGDVVIGDARPPGPERRSAEAPSLRARLVNGQPEIRRVVPEAGPEAATMARRSLSGSFNAMVVDVN